jgi:hypothetical protein
MSLRCLSIPTRHARAECPSECANCRSERHNLPPVRLILLDANIPGVTLGPTIELGFEQHWRTRHFLFNTTPDLPEELLQGRERIPIETVFPEKTANPAAVLSSDQVNQGKPPHHALFFEH